jgi:hypothetical protein
MRPQRHRCGHSPSSGRAMAHRMGFNEAAELFLRTCLVRVGLLAGIITSTRLPRYRGGTQEQEHPHVHFVVLEQGRAITLRRNPRSNGPEITMRTPKQHEDIRANVRELNEATSLSPRAQNRFDWCDRRRRGITKAAALSLRTPVALLPRARRQGSFNETQR